MHSELQEAILTYREYLFEAVGKTDFLDSLREKTIFVSYNRWHLDAGYRSSLFSKLGTGPASEPPRGHVAKFGPGSGFQSDSTRAENLQTCDRWREFVEEIGFATAAISHEIYAAELQFHKSQIPTHTILESALSNGSIVCNETGEEIET